MMSQHQTPFFNNTKIYILTKLPKIIKVKPKQINILANFTKEILKKDKYFLNFFKILLNFIFFVKKNCTYNLCKKLTNLY